MKRGLLLILVELCLLVLFGFWWTPKYSFSFLNQPQDSGKLILGLSKIELKGEETIGVQVDRVIRDIQWKNSDYDEKVPPDRVPEKLSEIVPYMEGARVREMMKYAGVKVIPLTPAYGKKKYKESYPKPVYYAGDGQGNFLFLIDPSKTEYFTVKRGSKGNLMLPDTHGFNMVAEQAYLKKDQLFLVIACMDMPDKAKAALYLAQNGINAYAPCDQFANELIGYKERFGVEVEILGSAPIKKTKSGAIIGDQPLTISLDELIIVQYTDKGYPDQYCDTPARYFDQLKKVYHLDLRVVKVPANVGETQKIVEMAELNQAQVIGVRVYNEADYQPVAEWLKEDPNHRAILFHSAAYRLGNRLFFEFPEQTTFGDLSPKIIK
ncbi:MAG: hypothetical protein U9O41_00950 [Candidatus Aerophobetes bacterium]|nr:hypothetical protein [Candidatus Aerophobetes bacterium]